MSWLNDHSSLVTSLINYVPVVATVVTCVFSLVLARATLRQVEATDKGLALAREEFEREWAPELHIKLRRLSATELEIVVTNLAKASVLLEVLQFRNLTGARPFEKVILNDPLIGGLTWAESIGDRLTAMTGKDFEGVVDISITFFAAGRMFRTDWFRFNVFIHNGHFMRADAITLPARRVKVSHSHGQPAELELAKDVVSAESRIDEE
jgi:hypothetical protein